jgi:hypothetical protein
MGDGLGRVILVAAKISLSMRNSSEDASGRHRRHSECFHWSFRVHGALVRIPIIKQPLYRRRVQVEERRRKIVGLIGVIYRRTLIRQMLHQLPHILVRYLNERETCLFGHLHNKLRMHKSPSYSRELARFAEGARAVPPARIHRHGHGCQVDTCILA